ncbi:MAG: bifunctional diaminohydroxyphosphoribosylaminopyrimidine deaminase/5-amino-6-(5-phosphoribosylamino)uracil reductase RibD [Gammaproteobacteria bacterium]|nr:bifunctional diaminohydroxyphosphoribosylaminopyrimidine deaminase/5-amino-6-(5-phosphoribosylamino)uracil reductase RibD [Gammaproteobacteria bacterium]
MTLTTDGAYMARAIQLARRGYFTARPNPVVGCVIVKDNQLVGEGFHRKAGEPHAEVHALNAAAANATGATAYVTLEPCSHTGRTPPCANALIEAGVKRVVVAMSDPNPEVAGQGLERLRAAGIEVSEGVLRAEAVQLNQGFIKRMTRGLPYVRVKLAMSLDGRTAMASGESKWITGEHARADVHRLRAASGAVMTGSGTVLADNPSLTYRVEDFELLRQQIPEDTEQPLRVVCDSRLQTPANARILNQPGKTLIATLQVNEQAETLQQSGAEVVQIKEDRGKISLTDLLGTLAGRGVNDVMVEAGAGMAGALLNEKLVDEFVIYMAPHLMGDNARGLVQIHGLEAMADRVALKINDIRAIGEDWKITAIPTYS